MSSLVAWRRPQAFDLTLALTVLVLCAVELVTGQVSGSLWAGALVTVCFAGPMLFARSSPWAALVVVYAGLVLCVLLHVDTYNFLGSVVSCVATVGILAAQSPLWPSLAGLVVAYACLVFTALTDAGGYLWGGFILGAAFFAGRLIWARQRLIDRLNATTAELERSREAQAALAVEAERARLARELHDVVAHSVSVMVVQAGAAERMVGVDPDRAAGALESVRTTGRQALDELRVLLGALGSPEGHGAETAPKPSLADLAQVMKPLQDNGIGVTLAVRGDVRQLPPGLELTAYRIVQESLTNVLKHSTAQAALVQLSYAADALDVDVTDDGTSATPVVAGAGRGLAGMAGRAEMYGGTMRSGARRGGGFAVHAHLPLPGTL